MDTNRVSQGQLIAGASAALLFIFTFLPWIKLEGIDDSASLWAASSSLDVFLLIVIAAALIPTVLAMMGSQAQIPFASAATTFLLGLIGVILVFFFLIGPVPSFGVPSDVGELPDADAKIGLWLGLLATAGIAVGGYLAMQDEAYGG